jgi:hypothetical protein
MTDLVATNQQLPALHDDAVDTILRETARSNPMLRFKEGKFYIGDDVVPLGTEYVADTMSWTRGWVKWVDGLIVDTKMDVVADGHPMLTREALGDLDESEWDANDKTGERRDPWQQQHILPFEDPETGEYLIFVTGTVGGRIAIEKLCNFTGRQYKQKRQAGLPVIRLNAKDMPTKFGGTKPRPEFPIVRWHNLPPIAADLNDEVGF